MRIFILLIYFSTIFISGNGSAVIGFGDEPAGNLSDNISTPTSTATLAPSSTSTLSPTSTLDSTPTESSSSTTSPTSLDLVKTELTSHFDVPEISLEHVGDLLLKLKELTHKKVFGNRVFSRDVS